MVHFAFPGQLPGSAGDARFVSDFGPGAEPCLQRKPAAAFFWTWVCESLIWQLGVFVVHRRKPVLVSRFPHVRAWVEGLFRARPSLHHKQDAANNWEGVSLSVTPRALLITLLAQNFFIGVSSAGHGTHDMVRTRHFVGLGHENNSVYGKFEFCSLNSRICRTHSEQPYRQQSSEPITSGPNPGQRAHCSRQSPSTIWGASQLLSSRSLGVLSLEFLPCLTA